MSINQAQRQIEQGSALFLRAYAFLKCGATLRSPYDSATAATDPGIPLRLSSNVTASSVRASVAASYNQVIGDLQLASSLLPVAIPTQNPNRPSRPAVPALLARIYLSIRAYSLARCYADSTLQLYDSLMDYNTLNPQSLFPFSNTNAEILYQSNILEYTECLAAIAYPNTIVDSTFYGSYAPQDLRRSLFYQLNANGQLNMTSGYAQLIWPFTGLATDELYLIRAECAARTGSSDAAMADLNTLLLHRYVTGTFTTITLSTTTQALDTILTERRKEMPFRGVRWFNLRRLNQEGRNIIPLRILNGIRYQLLLNSNLYTLPIPPDVIADNPSMIQNPR